MAPQHSGREFDPALVRHTPLYGSYSTSPDSASAFTIVVAVPGATPRAAASWPIGRSRVASGQSCCPQIDLLQVVLDGAGRSHGCRNPNRAQESLDFSTAIHHDFDDSKSLPGEHLTLAPRGRVFKGHVRPADLARRDCGDPDAGRGAVLARHRTGVAVAAWPRRLRSRRGRGRAEAHLGRGVSTASRHPGQPGRRARAQWARRRRARGPAGRLDLLDLLDHDDGTLRLTAEGRREALRVIRIHRLWERYLADETGLDAREWHAHAERREHGTSAQQAEALAATLGHPRYDPHGDPIPTPSGEVPPHQGMPLTQLSAGQVAEIVHLEDEPDAVFAQIIAAGLMPGMRVRVLERSPKRLRSGGRDRRGRAGADCGRQRRRCCRSSSPRPRPAR